MTNVSPVKALVPRTAALFILLYQLRLLASDLADTPVFIAALAGALLTAIFLNVKKTRGLPVRPFQALIIIALAPWAARFFIALPRWFFVGRASNSTILLDSLLLNFDRNSFVSLLPFYWIAVTTFFSMRSRAFLRADIIAADTFFLVLFSIAPASSIDAYRWPILMIGIFGLVFFLQILSLILSAPPEMKLRLKEQILAGAFLFLLIFLGGVLFIRPFQERAVERGGGLLEPKLFSFDFSQILRLESEISFNDDLVMIVKKDPDDYHILLRRYTLSGYSPKQGFFRHNDIDEAAHPRQLPGGRAALSMGEIENYRVTDQEYYLVNIDASAFIAMNMPVEVTPFETWDASSFNSAYAVRSHTSEALPFELIMAAQDIEDAKTGLGAEEYAFYTEYGGDEAIAAFAREIVSESGSGGSYWEQVQAVYNRLKYGEYRYSLKPGIAADGDQLKHFLFTAKKGYCSYYAFAFTVMLRSLGIPCRAAAGFFVDPSAEAFNYYPVRTDMAHAWAEVWFPGYGWIEYDPTTEMTAEGEEFYFSRGTPPELFERLMKEILENRSRLRIKESENAEGGKGSLAALGTLKFIIRWGPILAAAGLAFLFLAIRSGYLWLSLAGRKPRKKALYLWVHAGRRLALAGAGKSAAEAEAEWAAALDKHIAGIYSLYLDCAAARFAPVYTAEDQRKMAGRYRSFSAAYRDALPLRRRLLAWLLPPLALMLPAPKKANSSLRRLGPGMKTIGLLLLLLFTLRGESPAQDDGFGVSDSSVEAGANAGADALYENAMAAQRAENWERAVELYNEGSRSYPFDHRFPWALGNLYYYRELYRLAWDEYRRTEKILSRTPVVWPDITAGLLYQLANTAGYLNQNEASAAYYENFLAMVPDNRDAAGSLAWMYFKLHRLEEGEKLLLDAMERMGDDMDFSMTLGTMYAGLFRYRESKEAYLKAIHRAEAVGERLFPALAWYNLSILESRFYHFSLAYDCTNASLDAMDRASGRLARGELFLRRMEMSRTLAEFQEAYSTDSSPLSKLNLAQTYQIGGRLTEAVLYANDCLKVKNESWMLNYGIDPVRYKRDVHEILKDSYQGLFRAEAFSCPANLKESVQGLFRKISYRFRFALHAHLFRKYSLIAADAYRGGGWAMHGIHDEIHLEALHYYLDAFEAYPMRALDYLALARSFEEPIIPGSAPSYDYAEGRLKKNRKLLAETLSEFDPLWERDMIAGAYAELARLGKKPDRQDAAERLFAINRGALLRNGTRLPVKLEISGEIRRARILAAAKAAGLDPVESSRYTLYLSESSAEIACELYDGGRGITVWRQNLPLYPPKANSSRALFARSLRDGIFNAFGSH